MDSATIDGRKRILFVAEAVTLAHVARTWTLANLLPADRYRVMVACDPRYDTLFAWNGIERHELRSIPTARFEEALNKGAPLYQFETLMDYVEADRRAMQSFAPDVVVGDFRLSLGVSARLAGTPYVNVTNAGWSPYADPRFVVPDIELTRMAGPRLGQWLFDRFRTLSFAGHARPMNRLRRRYGMAPLPSDMRYAYTDGDHTLYADVPELIPLGGAPSTHAFLGPVHWSPKPPPPPWIDRIPADRPLAYVALGSSGRHAALPIILDALSGRGWTIVAGTAGKSLPGTARDDVFVADYLDGDEWASRASVVVCNGGSPTCYQALRHGVPVLGVPSNLDQYLNMAAVEDAGAGVLLRSGQASRERVCDGARRLVDEPSYANAAARLSMAMAGYDPGRILRETCDRAIAGAAAAR